MFKDKKRKILLSKNGFTILMVSTWLLMITTFAGITMLNSETQRIVNREKEYVSIISEYSVAISRFIFLNRRMPESMNELYSSDVRVLRKIYRDPFTGRKDSWILKRTGRRKVICVTNSNLKSQNGTFYNSWWVDKNFILHKNVSK